MTISTSPGSPTGWPAPGDDHLLFAESTGRSLLECPTDREADLEANLEELLREASSEKGFVLDRFLLRNIAFSTAYASAIEQKQVTDQERTQREYQAEQMRKLAEGERDKLKIEADGRAGAVERAAAAKATATVLQARADAEALRLINQALQRDP